MLLAMKIMLFLHQWHLECNIFGGKWPSQCLPRARSCHFVPALLRYAQSACHARHIDFQSENGCKLHTPAAVAIDSAGTSCSNCLASVSFATCKGSSSPDYQNTDFVGRACSGHQLHFQSLQPMHGKGGVIRNCKQACTCSISLW